MESWTPEHSPDSAIPPIDELKVETLESGSVTRAQYRYGFSLRVHILRGVLLPCFPSDFWVVTCDLK